MNVKTDLQPTFPEVADKERKEAKRTIKLFEHLENETSLLEEIKGIFRNFLWAFCLSNIFWFSRGISTSKIRAKV